jgi:RimJ/RimL family protein N-acetyltransferase
MLVPWRSRGIQVVVPTEPFRLRLRDGSTVLLRPMHPDDADGVWQAFEHLSLRSRFLRFHTASPHLVEAALRALIRADHRAGDAWVALDPGATVVGVASYHRALTSPGVAEAVVAVVDRMQGKGLGTALLGALIWPARAEGIEVFRSYVLAENIEMLQILDELGATREPLTTRVQEVDLQLPDRVAGLPDTAAGRALKMMERERVGGPDDRGPPR